MKELRQKITIGVIMAAVLVCASIAGAYTRDWSNSSPIDHTLNSSWPAEIRKIRVDVSDRLTGQIYGFTAGESTEGVKHLLFVDQASDPTVATDKIQLFGKAVSTKTELFFEDEDANVTQVTNAGYLNAAAFGSQVIPAANVGFPSGSIIQYAGSSAPSGWLLCDGSAVSRTTYSTLFAVTSTLYGSGDGTTTFNVPNFKSKGAMGYNASDTPFDTIGETGGEQTHTLTVPEMPAHSHQLSMSSSGGATGSHTYEYNGSGGDSAGALNVQITGETVNPTGGGGSHNVLDPYVTVNFIIKT